MASIFLNAANWAADNIAKLPKEQVKNGISYITNAIVDKLLPGQKNKEANKFLKEVVPGLVMTIGAKVYKAFKASHPTPAPQDQRV